jgi:hypothetical protein
LDGNHVFALPLCIASFHLPSPRMGSARGSSVLSSLEERNFAEVGTFQPSLGFNGLRPVPRPQLQGSSSSLLGRRARRAGALPPARVGGPPLLPASGGGNHPPALRRRRPPAMPRKANCCCPARVQHSVLCPHFRGEDRSEDLPVRFGRPALAGAVLVDAVVGADLVAAGESFSTDKPVSATRGPTSGSLALMSGSRPLSGDANESLLAASFVLGPSLLPQRSLASHREFVAPQALRWGGCSYPREWNRSSVCNGTLSAGVCSLWLSGLNMYVFLA